MATNVSSVGFDIGSQEELESFIRRVLELSKPAPTYVGGAYLHYQSPEGCELWAQFSPDRQLIGCNPHFAGNTRFRVRVTAVQAHGATPLDGQLIAELLEDEPGVPIVINVPDYRQYAARLDVPVEATVQMVAIAQELSTFASEEDLARSRFQGLYADGAFIPSGTFLPGGELREPPVPLAVLSGRVRRAERLVNSVGGLPFYVVEVKTLGGVLDILADIEYITSEPLPGHVVVGSFFISGRLIEPLPPPPTATAAPNEPSARQKGKSSWLRRMIGGSGS